MVQKYKLLKCYSKKYSSLSPCLHILPAIDRLTKVRLSINISNRKTSQVNKLGYFQQAKGQSFSDYSTNFIVQTNKNNIGMGVGE